MSSLGTISIGIQHFQVVQAITLSTCSKGRTNTPCRLEYMPFVCCQCDSSEQTFDIIIIWINEVKKKSLSLSHGYNKKNEPFSNFQDIPPTNPKKELTS
jgi:hypothetical protein